MRALLLIALALAWPVAAKVVVTDAVIRPAPAGAPVTAAYMTLRNTGSKPVALTGVHCACAAAVTAHETSSEGGVMRMRPAPHVVIPAQGQVAFKPGGLHLMVMGPKRPLKTGERTPMRLTFDGAPSPTVNFSVKP